MGVRAIVGANWGDEGKGKIVDSLAAEADVVVRFQGGSNAGHTIINHYGKFVLHLLPSGVFYPHTLNLLGPGTAVNIPVFLKEYHSLQEKGVSAPQIKISGRAQVVLPYHQRMDAFEEDRLGERKYGSTRSGIAPFYADKYLKTGIQLVDLFDENLLYRKIKYALESKNVLFQHLYRDTEMEAEEVTSDLLWYRDSIEPFVGNTTEILREAATEGKRILLEGQLGALRDPDHGIYPYSTSSSTLAGFASVGAGIPPYAIKNVTAVTKAYSSCVGEGPFVTELSGEEGENLRRLGGDAGEYGAATGRPRRVGWFDAVATCYGCRTQGATEAVLTMLDVLGYLDKIPVCTAYEIGGGQVEDFPVTPLLEQARPVYTMLPGWRCDISGVRNFQELPREARDYVNFIEECIGVPVKWISVGSKREEIIAR